MIKITKKEFQIGNNVKIGKNCNIGQNIFIGEGVVIGDNVKIQNNVSVYSGVNIKKDVFIGPSVVFTNIVTPRSFINAKKKYLKTVIDIGATLGANCTIICGVEVGEFAFVGAGSLVNKNVTPYALMVGVPCKQIGWMSEYGEKLDLPVLGNAQTTCKHTGQQYFLKNDQLTVSNK